MTIYLYFYLFIGILIGIVIGAISILQIDKQLALRIIEQRSIQLNLSNSIRELSTQLQNLVIEYELISEKLFGKLLDGCYEDHKT